jgi:ribonuclease P protein component
MSLSGRHNTFPRSGRLTKSSEFSQVFKEGKKLVGRHFICYVASHEKAGSKLGFAVSRKIGGAVVRNRVKRYLREFFRTHRTAFQVPIHLVVVARPTSAKLSFRECTETMERLLRRGGVWDD